MKTPDVLAAEWLVVGFDRDWNMAMLETQMRASLGYGFSGFAFFPQHPSLWFKRRTQSFVQQNWPKLNDFLHKASAEQKLRAAGQIVKLKWDGRQPVQQLSRAECAELYRDKRRVNAEFSSYMMSRAAFKTQKSDWGTCK